MSIAAVIASSVSADNPFFLVTGLPVHTLVVHFAVSMIPLSAIALIAIVLVPRWRGAFLWATLIGLTIGTGAAFISKESGEALAAVVGVPKTHSTWGDLLPWLALLLLAVAILWAWLSRHAPKKEPVPMISLGSGLQLIVGIIAIVLSIMAFALTVVVGHTGAAAVWASRSLDSETKEDAPSTTPTTPATTGSAAASAAPGSFTMADVQAHATPQDCWSVVNGTVYDLTTWISQHPGGPGVIENMCGTDGTAAFEGQHSGSASAAQALTGLAKGPLAGAATAGSAAAAASSAPASAAASSAAASAAPGTYTMADVEAHSTSSDCWSVVDGKVYDLTSWIPQHPGGAGVIEGMCGVDGSAAYNGQHGGDPEISGVLSSFEIGTLAA